MAVVVRVSERFYNQLVKARKILSQVFKKDVTFVDITDKIFLKILIMNKNPRKNSKEIFADWEIRPIVIVVKGFTRHRNKRASLEMMKIDFTPQVEHLWK